MTLSNYPPGVTGREPEIAGPLSEREEWRECDATASLLIVPVDVDLASIARDLYQAEKDRIEWVSIGDGPLATARTDNLTGYVAAVEDAVVRLNKSVRLLYEAEDITCPFGGEVDVAHHHDGSTWTCPVCRTDYFEAKPERGD